MAQEACLHCPLNSALWGLRSSALHSLYKWPVSLLRIHGQVREFTSEFTVRSISPDSLDSSGRQQGPHSAPRHFPVLSMYPWTQVGPSGRGAVLGSYWALPVDSVACPAWWHRDLCLGPRWWPLAKQHALKCILRESKSKMCSQSVEDFVQECPQQLCSQSPQTGNPNAHQLLNG